MTRVLGLDWGTRRVGAAISDDDRRIAVGLAVWPADEQALFPLIQKTISENDVGLIVVGYPLSLNGTEGPSARAVNVFIERLARFGIPVTRADERFTSDEAGRALSRAGVSQKKQRGKLDMAAAVLLLQSFLDEASQS